MRGFCTSKYFNEYGLIWSPSPRVKPFGYLTKLFEVQTKIL
jgi:hypothetical protein